MRPNRIEKICEKCGAPFCIRAHRSHIAKFCSMSCLWSGRRKPGRTLVDVICEQCGESYQVTTSRKLKTRFCSQRCAGLVWTVATKEARLKAIASVPRNRMDPETKALKKKEIDWRSYRKNIEKRSIYGAQRYRSKKDQIVAGQKKWRERNAEKVRQDGRKKREIRGDILRAARRQHYRDNKPIYIANARKRESHIARAIPPWADLKKIELLYVQAAKATAATGIKHHVDHIYPLQSKVMCGLHVEANLQVIPALINLRKSNAITDAPQIPLCCAWPSMVSASLCL